MWFYSYYLLLQNRTLQMTDVTALYENDKTVEAKIAVFEITYTPTHMYIT